MGGEAGPAEGAGVAFAPVAEGHGAIPVMFSTSSVMATERRARKTSPAEESRTIHGAAAYWAASLCQVLVRRSPPAPQGAAVTGR